jgi:hypothetical protein
LDLLKSELSRNITGYFLVLLGMIAVGYGGHFHFDKMVDLGASLVTASLVAFQAKRTPDGNTTTTQITVPPPAVAPPPTVPEKDAVLGPK